MRSISEFIFESMSDWKKVQKIYGKLDITEGRWEGSWKDAKHFEINTGATHNSKANTGACIGPGDEWIELHCGADELWWIVVVNSNDKYTMNVFDDDYELLCSFDAFDNKRAIKFLNLVDEMQDCDYYEMSDELRKI